MKARTHGLRLLCLSGFLLLGCTRSAPAAGGAVDAGDGVSSEASAPPRAVTEADVEAYVRYRRALDPLPAPTARPGWVGLRERSRAEERALRDAGLSEDGLEAVEPLVLEVMGRLQLVKVSQVEETLTTYQQVRDALPADQQKTLEPAVTKLRERKERLQSLAAVRQRYGNAPVEAVLRNAAELTLPLAPSPKDARAPGK